MKAFDFYLCMRGPANRVTLRRKKDEAKEGPGHNSSLYRDFKKAPIIAYALNRWL